MAYQLVRNMTTVQISREMDRLTAKPMTAVQLDRHKVLSAALDLRLPTSHTEAINAANQPQEPACDFCNDTQQIDGEACGWCVDVAYPLSGSKPL